MRRRNRDLAYSRCYHPATLSNMFKIYITKKSIKFHNYKCRESFRIRRSEIYNKLMKEYLKNSHILKYFLKEPVAPNLTYHFFKLYIKYITTQTFTLLPVAPRQCLCHYFIFYHSNFPPSWKKNSQGQQSKACVYYVTRLQKFPLAQKHTIKTIVFLYLFPGV